MINTEYIDQIVQQSDRNSWTLFIESCREFLRADSDLKNLEFQWGQVDCDLSRSQYLSKQWFLSKKINYLYEKIKQLYNFLPRYISREINLIGF